MAVPLSHRLAVGADQTKAPLLTKQSKGAKALARWKASVFHEVLGDDFDDVFDGGGAFAGLF